MKSKIQVEYKELHGRRPSERLIFKAEGSLFNHVLSYAKTEYERKYLYPFPTQTIQVFLEKKIAKTTLEEAFLLVSLEKEMSEIEENEYIEQFQTLFPDFLLRRVNVLEIGKTKRLSFKFLPIKICDDSPILRTGFHSLGVTPDECVMLFQKTLEKLYKARVRQNKREEILHDFSTKKATISFHEELGDYGYSELLMPLTQEMIEMKELREENRLLLEENLKLKEDFFSSEEESGKEKWILLSSKEFDELSENIRFIDQVWRVHTQLLRTLSSQTERTLANKKREKILEIQQNILAMRMRKVLDDTNHIISKKGFFERTGKIKITQEDYRQFSEISSFVHYLENENQRLQSLVSLN